MNICGTAMGLDITAYAGTLLKYVVDRAVIAGVYALHLVA